MTPDPAWLEELFDWVRIPSVSADPTRSGDVRAAGEWVCEFVRAAGGECELVDLPLGPEREAGCDHQVGDPRDNQRHGPAHAGIGCPHERACDEREPRRDGEDRDDDRRREYLREADRRAMGVERRELQVVAHEVARVANQRGDAMCERRRRLDGSSTFEGRGHFVPGTAAIDDAASVRRARTATPSAGDACGRRRGSYTSLLL